MKNRKRMISIIAGILAVTMLAGLVISLIPTRAAAASSSEIQGQINDMKKEQKEIEKQISELKKKQSSNLSEIKALANEKSLLEQQAALLESQMDLLNEQIAAYSVLIADKQEEMDQAEKRLAQLTEKNKERIRAMEENGKLSYWSVLFRANSFSDLLDRLSMIHEIADADRQRMKEMQETAQLIEQTKAELLVEREALKENKDSLDKAQEELTKKKQEKDGVIQKLIARGEEYEKLELEQDAELNKLEDEIANAKLDLDEAKKREYQEWLATMTQPTTAAPGGSNVDKDGITWLVPCNYRAVTSPFDPNRMHPIYHVQRPHNGVDLGAPCPTKIIASRAGVVVAAKYNQSAGYYVTIDHLDGYRSTYMHMCKSPSVKVGEVVAAGQVIGCVGSTGASTGNHLHFGISKNGKWVNPMPYIT